MIILYFLVFVKLLVYYQLSVTTCIWEDTYKGKIYKHYFDCTFCWDSRMELHLGLLEIEAKEHNNIYLNWEQNEIH